MKVKTKFHIERAAKGRVVVAAGEKKERPKKIPRVAKLMALAIKLDDMIRQGVGKDHAEIARLGQVSRARVSQVMGLLNLAPDLQETILCGTCRITERELREAVKHVDWKTQKALASAL